MTAWARGSVVALIAAGCVLAACSGDESDPEVSEFGPDEDEDGWPEAFDCDDTDSAVFPSADDIPGDDIDQDCSGSDASEPSFGGAAPCDGSDCDGSGGATPTGGSGGSGASSSSDRDGDGHDASPDGDDCDDLRLEVHPGAPEIVLNGIDENCDGSDLVGVGDVIGYSEDAVPAEPADLAAGLVDGEPHLLAAWSDSRVAPRQDLYAQLLNLDGEAVGPEIAVDTDDNHAKSGVRVVGSGDGFLVSWSTDEGVFVRRLGADGTPDGIVLGFGAAGGERPVPAFSNAHWAVAWTESASQKAFIRAMTTGGVRGDILELEAAVVSAVSLVGNEDGFLAITENELDELSDEVGARGLVGHPRSKIGTSTDDPFVIYEGAAAGPSLAFDGSGYFVAFRASGSFGYAAGLRITADNSLVASEVTRLSTESPFQWEFRAASAESGFIAAWNDDRHLSHAPPAESIYGAVLDADGAPAHRAILAAETARMGGLIAVDDDVFLSVSGPDGDGILVQSAHAD